MTEHAIPSRSSAAVPASARVTLRRGADRGEHDPATIRSILRAALVAHVGVQTADGPIVLPMAYGLGDGFVYLHGALSNALLRGAVDTEVCVTVTILDGLVVARTPFHDSMDYRSVVVRGRARLVTDERERLDALRAITDHVVAHFDQARPPSDEELRRTRVLAVSLAEASAKIRSGGPADDPDDVAGPHWGGHVPVRTVFEAAVPSADLSGPVDPPDAVTALAGRSADER